MFVCFLQFNYAYRDVRLRAFNAYEFRQRWAHQPHMASLTWPQVVTIGAIGHYRTLSDTLVDGATFRHHRSYRSTIGMFCTAETYSIRLYGFGYDSR